ncbi:MAG TPA: ABC transporter ATP-binding protein [Gaiellaceae bacterium]|jgi:ABC-type polysaccharide/polyol phosphate transport system ATPase subunit|nr:ABC transporter ATP-binding protein [Gaiellaceae bacterium]
MTNGRIVLEHASRRFRVYPQEARTLKELVVNRRRARGTDVWALRDASIRVEPGEAVGLVGRNGSGKTTLLKLVAGIIKPTSGVVEVGGRVGSLLELGAGFHPDFTGRENVYLNGSLLGLPRRVVREHLDEIVAFAGIDEFVDLPVRTYSSGMAMRLGFAVAAHLDVDVLLLDEVFAVGDEEFQRKCFGKIFEFKQRGGTIVFVSHDASAVERLCERTVLLRGGHVEFDGSTHDAILRYHRQLAAERDPEERGAGLREWGSGEARIADVELLDADGEPRRQFLAGEPLALRLRLVAEQPLDAPRLVYELRGESGLLLAVNALDTSEVGWDRAPGELRVRFDVGRLPLADGRFTLRLGLSDPGGGRLYHQLDDAVSFLVHPGGEEGGLMRLEGTWSREEVTTAA